MDIGFSFLWWIKPYSILILYKNGSLFSKVLYKSQSYHCDQRAFQLSRLIGGVEWSYLLSSFSAQTIDSLNSSEQLLLFNLIFHLSILSHNLLVLLLLKFLLIDIKVDQIKIVWYANLMIIFLSWINIISYMSQFITALCYDPLINIMNFYC